MFALGRGGYQHVVATWLELRVRRDPTLEAEIVDTGVSGKRRASGDHGTRAAALRGVALGLRYAHLADLASALAFGE